MVNGEWSIVNGELNNTFSIADGECHGHSKDIN